MNYNEMKENFKKLFVENMNLQLEIEDLKKELSLLLSFNGGNRAISELQRMKDIKYLPIHAISYENKAVQVVFYGDLKHYIDQRLILLGGKHVRF